MSKCSATKLTRRFPDVHRDFGSASTWKSVVGLKDSGFKEVLWSLENTLLRLPGSIAKIVFMAKCSLNKFRLLNLCRHCGEHMKTTITQKSPNIWLS